MKVSVRVFKIVANAAGNIKVHAESSRTGHPREYEENLGHSK